MQRERSKGWGRSGRAPLAALASTLALVGCSSDKHAGDDARRDAVTANASAEASAPAIVVPAPTGEAAASASATTRPSAGATECDHGAKLARIDFPQCAVFGARDAASLPPSRAWTPCTKGLDKTAGCRELTLAGGCPDQPKLVAVDDRGPTLVLAQPWRGGTLVELIELEGKTNNAIGVSDAVPGCSLDDVEARNGRFVAWFRVAQPGGGTEVSAMGANDGAPAEPLGGEAAFGGGVHVVGQVIKGKEGAAEGHFPEAVRQALVVGDVAVARAADDKHVYSGRVGETATAILTAPAGATISALGVSDALLVWLEQRGEACTLSTSLRAEKADKIAARKLGRVPCAGAITVGPAHAVVGEIVVRLSDGRRFSPWKGAGLVSGAFTTASDVILRLDGVDAIQRLPLASLGPGEPMPTDADAPDGG